MFLRHTEKIYAVNIIMQEIVICCSFFDFPAIESLRSPVLW